MLCNITIVKNRSGYQVTIVHPSGMTTSFNAHWSMSKPNLMAEVAKRLVQYELDN